jgi:UDP-sulfoquinovose synthase
VENPPESGERVKIRNQTTETHRVRDLANLVGKLTGAEIEYLPNPRKEAAENELEVENKSFLELGLNPITLEEGLLTEVIEIADKYKDRHDPRHVYSVSYWTKEQEEQAKTTKPKREKASAEK